MTSARNSSLVPNTAAAVAAVFVAIAIPTRSHATEPAECQPEGGDKGAFAELQEFGRAWAVAYKSGDVIWLERNLADDVFIVLPNGAVRSKRESIESVRNRKGSVEVFETAADGHCLRVRGNLAVETGLFHFVAHDARGQLTDGTYRFTVAYERRAGRWLVVVDQVTSMQ